MKALKISAVVLAVLVAILAVLYLTGYGGKLVGSAFLAYNKPSGEPAYVAPEPDYGMQSSWAALPDMNDPADLVPAGIAVAKQGEHPVDTFFIHPTGFLKSSSWTSPMDPNSATEENTQWMMANQASAYNGCCNVYAPRYREATIFSYFGELEDREQALGLAYDDVKRAFGYYLTHYNQGRPFIIASHSQGSHHALHLLKDFIDNSELHERMVAAYLIGAVIIPVSPSWFDSLSNITACESADDLQCVVHWDTMPEGAEPIPRPEDSLCTNPLSWQVTEEKATADLHEGAVVPEGTYNLSFGRKADTPTEQTYQALPAPVPEHTWAQCQDGFLYVAIQQDNGFQAMGSADMNSYHGLDYALFYMNIHNNAKLRTERWLRKHRSSL